MKPKFNQTVSSALPSAPCSLGYLFLPVSRSVSSLGFRPLLSRSQYRSWLENSLTRNADPQSISARKSHAVIVILVDSCRTRIPSIAALSNGKHTKTSANAENHALYPHLRNLGFGIFIFVANRGISSTDRRYAGGCFRFERCWDGLVVSMAVWVCEDVVGGR